MLWSVDRFVNTASVCRHNLPYRKVRPYPAIRRPLEAVHEVFESPITTQRFHQVADALRMGRSTMSSNYALLWLHGSVTCKAWWGSDCTPFDATLYHLPLTSHIMLSHKMRPCKGQNGFPWSVTALVRVVPPDVEPVPPSRCRDQSPICMMRTLLRAASLKQCAMATEDDHILVFEGDGWLHSVLVSQRIHWITYAPRHVYALRDEMRRLPSSPVQVWTTSTVPHYWALRPRFYTSFTLIVWWQSLQSMPYRLYEGTALRSSACKKWG